MIGCVLCENCALCHKDLLGKEASNVHSLQEHASFQTFDIKQNPMAMAVCFYFIIRLLLFLSTKFF